MPSIDFNRSFEDNPGCQTEIHADNVPGNVFYILFSITAMTTSGSTSIALLMLLFCLESRCSVTIFTLGLRGLRRHCGLRPHTKKGGSFLVADISGGVVFLPIMGAGNHLELSPGATLRWRVGSSSHSVQRSCHHGNPNDGLSRICSICVNFYNRETLDVAVIPPSTMNPERQ